MSLISLHVLIGVDIEGGDIEQQFVQTLPARAFLWSIKPLDHSATDIYKLVNLLKSRSRHNGNDTIHKNRKLN